MNKHLSICFMCAFALLVVPLTLFAACFQGDTNGDGIADTVCENPSATRIEITHGGSGTTTYYTQPTGSSFAINTLTDTDGQPGVEVVVVVLANGNGPDGVQVIHDRQASQHLYGMPIGSSFAINTVQDTDGNAGAEIVVVLLANGNGPDGVQVIHDSQGSQHLYDMPIGSSFAINTVQDTDGIAGADIVVVLNNPYWIQVIHDRIASAFTYEIFSPYSILAVRDYDGITGAEICYTKSSQFFLITDRTHSTTTRSGC